MKWHLKNRSRIALLRLIASRFRQRSRADSPLAVVVFSRDRALQLQALLDSMAAFVSGSYSVYVLWCASNHSSECSYRELFSGLFPFELNSLPEKQFRKDLLSLLSHLGNRRLMFLVDDIIFVRPFNTEWAEGIDTNKVVPSIRLDDRVTFCQPSQLDCPVPKLKHFSADLPWQEFSWTESTGPWAMPLSVDGHIFDTAEMLIICSSIPFSAPNSLEANLGPYRFWFKYRSGLCLQQRAIINLAMNRVQTENVDFPCGEVSSDELLRLWTAGKRLDWRKMATAENNSTHVVVHPVFAEPNSSQ